MTGSTGNTGPFQNQCQFPEGNSMWDSLQPGLLTQSLARMELTGLACSRAPYSLTESYNTKQTCSVQFTHVWSHLLRGEESLSYTVSVGPVKILSQSTKTTTTKACIYVRVSNIYL